MYRKVPRPSATALGALQGTLYTVLICRDERPSGDYHDAELTYTGAVRHCGGSNVSRADSACIKRSVSLVPATVVTLCYQNHQWRRAPSRLLPRVPTRASEAPRGATVPVGASCPQARASPG
jgi:hypothetical protein